MKETVGEEFYESADKVITVSRPETFEGYLQRLKDRRTEDSYKYTDEDFIQYQEYIKDCYNTNLSVYKCLEFMSFAEREIKLEDVFNDKKKEPKQDISIRLKNSLKQFNLTLQEAINIESFELKTIGFGSKSVIEIQSLKNKEPKQFKNK